jgi:hypothetical protein
MAIKNLRHAFVVLAEVLIIGLIIIENDTVSMQYRV